MARYLLCTDLDRTLLPNGAEPESPEARTRFAELAARPEIHLAYVSGRSLDLIRDAIHTWNLPEPDFAVGDVGTSIYLPIEQTAGGHEKGWQRWDAWDQDIAPDWKGRSPRDLAALFDGMEALTLQEEARQSTFKLSYFVPLDTDQKKLLSRMEALLEKEQIKAALTWSVDEPEGIGLLDVLPACATKKHAVEFLMQHQGFNQNQTVFAGDSGNDLPVLTSSVQSVLVANAHQDVREEARREADPRTLFLAEGGLLGMNGNYAAGILEGFLHFVPEAKTWLQEVAV